MMRTHQKLETWFHKSEKTQDWNTHGITEVSLFSPKLEPTPTMDEKEKDIEEEWIPGSDLKMTCVHLNLHPLLL